MNEVNNILNSINIKKSTPLIMSVSGGVDSMVMLDYLFKNGFNVIVVHFNHNTRSSNVLDEELIIDYCTKNNLKYHIININVTTGNFQETARNLRYYHLKQVAKKYKSKFIFTAHHLDDLAETILIKLTRGSNLYGYAGIHSVYTDNSYTYVRPLLYLSKKAIKEYAKDQNVPYLDDFTNFETTYLRNRYRHTVMPILKQENEQFLNKVLNYHLQLSKASSFIRKYSKKYIKNNEIIIDKLIKEDDYIIENALAILLEDNNINFTYETILKLVTLIKEDKPNLAYDLSNNKLFIKAYNTVLIKEDKERLNLNQELRFGENVLTNMEIVTLLKDDGLDTQEFTKLCYNKLEFPLIVRSRNNGDLLSFTYGHKKLKDLLIDLKMPKYLRDELMIITDSNDTILWIPNVYLNETLGQGENLYLKIGDNNVK